MKRITLSDEQILMARAMWSAGEPHAAIAEAIGVSIDTFHLRLRDQLSDLPPRSRRLNRTRQGVTPTPEEIATATAAIRASWPEERWTSETLAQPTRIRDIAAL